MKINVSGSKSKLQSSLDFYLKITSLQEYKSLDDMRKKMFNTFMREENARSDLNELYSTDGVFEEAVTTELDIEKEVLETENVDLESEKEQIEKEKIILEPEKKHLENEFVEYVSHGRFVDGEDVGSIEFLNSVKKVSGGSVAVRDDLEFVSHGKYVEDYTARKEELEYVGHGRYVEDYSAVENEETNGYDTVEEFSDTYETDSDGNADLAEEADFCEEVSDIYETDSDVDLVEEVVSEEDSALIDEDTLEEDFLVENTPDDGIVSEEDVFADELEEEDVGSSFEDMVVDEPEEEEIVLKEPKELDVEDIVLEDAEDPNKRVTKEDVLLKPSNIRDFIRQNGRGVEESLALKYYSKKEINDALRKTKIYKKNGKLYI